MHTIREITRLATMLAGLIAPRIQSPASGQVGFYLVQALSGHGYFNAYRVIRHPGNEDEGARWALRA